MKKIKLLSIILCFSMLLGVWGCSKTDLSPVFDEHPPWSQQGNACTEIARYDFARYLSEANPNPDFILEGEDESKGYKLTSSGSLTYTIKEGVSLNLLEGEWRETPNSGHTLIKMELTATYKSDLSFVPAAVRSLHENKADSMFAYTVLNRYTLNSLFTFKQAEIETQVVGDTKSYTLTADYTGDFLGARKAVVKDELGENTLSIKSGEYFDSESIYFQIRAMQSVAEGGGNSTFNISLPYNDTLEEAKKLSKKSAKQVTAADISAVLLPSSLKSSFNIPEGAVTESDTSGMFRLDCFKTALTLTTKKPGAETTLYYSVYPVQIKHTEARSVATNKVLAKIEYPNHDKFTNAVYNQEFVLAAYSNSYWL